MYVVNYDLMELGSYTGRKIILLGFCACLRAYCVYRGSKLRGYYTCIVHRYMHVRTTAIEGGPSFCFLKGKGHVEKKPEKCGKQPD